MGFAGLWLGGCGAPRMVGPDSAVRVVVLDGILPPEHYAEETVITGWWLSARDIHRDPNDALLWGDALAEALERGIPNLKVHSRLDLRSYMTKKDDRLKKAFPELSGQERRKLLAEQSPVDYGRSLGADFVVASRLDDSHFSHHRTFHWWSAVVEVEVDLWDVARGEKVWTWAGRDRKMLSSVFGAMKGQAVECANRAGGAGVFATLQPVAPNEDSK